MATISSLDDGLDLSVLNSLNFDEIDQKKQEQNQTPTNASETEKEPLDLSSLDNLFPKKRQSLSSPPSKITSGFGYRKDPFTGARKFHNGVDIPIALNTPINSLGKGTVIEVGDSGKKDYGKFVKVDYGDGLVLTYGHLNKQAVEPGDRITSEAVIGLSGSTGRSKSPHLHIKAELNGKPVNPVDYFGNIHDVAIGALSTDDVVDGAKLDLSVLDNLDESKIQEEVNNEKLDLSPVDQIGELGFGKGIKGTDFNFDLAKPLEEKPYVDRRTVEEKIAAGAASLSQPKITGPNPNQLTGDRITTIIPVKGVNRPDINTITDYWLGAINPSYSQINQEYRAQTGKNLIEFNGNAEYIGDNKYKLTARMTKGATDLINAYINGRNKGGPQAGWEAAYFKSQEIKREEQKVREQIDAAKQANINILAEKHPYIKAAFNILSPATLIDKEAIKSGIGQAGLSDAQLVHNLRMLPEALYTLYRYGGDSQQYQDLIDKDREIQNNLFSYQREIPSPENISEKVGTGVVTGLVSFPKYAALGSMGIGTLPTLAYIENLHRGNIEAAKAALPMALMVGATHGLDSFFNKGTDLYITKEKNGVSYIEKIEVSRGQGSFAPFAKVRSELNDLSIKQDATDAFLASNPVSIKSISPLTRQLMMRGTNALLMSGTTLAEGGSAKDVASNLIVGLTFPVGKYKVGSLEEGNFGLIPYTPRPDIIASRRNVEIPNEPNITQLIPEIQSTPEKLIFLNMDTAALRLLELRKAQKEGKLGGTNIKEALARQMAAIAAIDILDKQIPKEIQNYFAQNETLIRAGLKTNGEAVRAKEEYLGETNLTPEPTVPEEIKENPSIDLKESPVQRLMRVINRVGNIKDNPTAVNEAAKEVFGNYGEMNTWQTPDRTLLAFDRFLSTKSKGGKTLRSGLDLAAIGKDLVEGSKAIWDLTQISAFYLEDFYHRKIEPTSVELANKFRVALGDIVKNFTDDDFQKLFVEGKKYLDSNVADPFFSRMKQDAVEKLPNRMTAEQARNVLSQHKDEFEWTSGLQDFLEANKDKKISKQDLIDVIQKGQVRVEESVAKEVDPNEYKRLVKRSQELTKQYDDLEDKFSDEATRIDLEREKVHDQIDEIREGDKPRYSLQAYQGEKLELPGAKNSKEVKLISDTENVWRKSYDPDDGIYYLENILTGEKLEVSDKEYNEGKPYGKPLYKSPHWDEPNVVAHYRSNDRVTTDNKKVYFGEEFQSDWNHDIREKGLKQGPTTPEEKIELQELNKRDRESGKPPVEEFTPEELARWNLLRQKELGRGIELNPFMQHNWKELVLKRFLRDAAIAKDENGNYKYDGIGWTTARQQLERYGGILEGKNFRWRKNSNGTYSFDFQRLGEETTEYAGWDSPHELSNISLERFAELTTPEAAQEVRDQEAAIEKRFSAVRKGMEALPGYEELLRNKEPGYDIAYRERFPESYEAWRKLDQGLTEIKGGQFSLKEAVELRGGKEGKYGDYDVAYKNILSKVGKRFGAKYSEKEISTADKDYSNRMLTDRQAIKETWDNDGALKSVLTGENLTLQEALHDFDTGLEVYTIDYHPDIQKIHYLEITPSMRSSLEKEGLPLYGTGGSEALKYAETGVRNRIVTADVFNSAREDLITKLSQLENKGIIFNSGLNPDAFIDQIKLLYSGIKDLQEFTNTLIDRYGPAIAQHAEDLYFAIKQQAADFKERLSIPLDKWSDNIKQDESNPAWQIRQFFESEEGALKLPKFLRKDKIPELENYLKDPESHQKPIGLDFRAWMRGIALAQISEPFAKVYDTMRTLQRVTSNYETNTISELHAVKPIIKSKLDAPVAEAIYQGNEWVNPATGEREGKVWSDAELISNFGLNTQQINAYKNVRAAVDNVLNLRLEGKLYAVREKATKLNDKLLMAALGSPEELSLKTQLLDLADARDKMIKYYDDLKNSGYITLQRKGDIAVYLEDPAYPVGDPNRKIYNQFSSRKQAVKWIEAQKQALGIPKNIVAGRMYDIRNLKDIALKEQLTPSQFEDLVDRSGAHTNDAEIEKIRAEVYSKFPSFTYQLKREFVRGYDRDLQTAINSIVDQLELYASSFYSKVGREEGLKALEATGIEKTDPNLYRLSSSYIADETTASKINWLSKAAITARRGTYLFQLGFDVNQLWMNAVAQPITQTYGYFYRVADPSGSGKQLTGLEPEHYFIKAAKETLNWRLGKSSPEFNDVVDRLIADRVLSPEFVHTLIESQTGTRKTSKVEHWASIFMREGEKQTRLHAAAEGYFVGKEKFNLQGDDLINFITRAVDATQSNPTRGENPFVVRQLGEGGKLFYQFGAFNQMWWENLALGVKQSKGVTRKSLFLARELAPLAIFGGISALPLSMFAGTMYTLVTGRDPKKDWDKFLGDDTLIERLARYGVSTSATISRKISPNVPVIDPLIQTLTSPTVDTLGDTLTENIPFFATAEQLRRGITQVASGDYFKGIINLSPRALRGPLKMVQTSGVPFTSYRGKGYKAGETTTLPRSKITPVQKIGQFINIAPTQTVEYYDTQRTKQVKKLHKKLKRIL